MEFYVLRYFEQGVRNIPNEYVGIDKKTAQIMTHQTGRFYTEVETHRINEQDVYVVSCYEQGQKSTSNQYITSDLNEALREAECMKKRYNVSLGVWESGTLKDIIILN